MNLVGYGLGYLPPGKFIVMAGEVSLLMNQLLNHTRNPLVTCIMQKIILVSDANDAELQALIENSRGIILPIIGGGGSNLKTAEALISNKPIIATTFAFRGYESYIQNENVYIADTKGEFINKIKLIFNKNLLSDRRSKTPINKELTWDGRFEEYGEKVKSIILGRMI
jgi:glycosyltransferase involved in cell wall biosynthesis